MPAVKAIPHPTLGQVRFGRIRPRVRYPQLHLRNYLMRTLPSPPPAGDFTAAALAALSQVHLNDRLGDCVIAGQENIEAVFTSALGPPAQFPDADTIRLYGAIGQYVDGDPATDNGCDMQTALAYWKEKGLLADGTYKLGGYISLDPHDPVEIRTALWLFENLYIGLELPDPWVNPMPQASGFTWDVAGEPDPNNGHCIIAAGYTTAGVTIVTWGMLGLLTDAALSKYCAASAGGELYTLISPDGINKASQRSRNGFDWSQLVADFDAMAWPGRL